MPLRGLYEPGPAGKSTRRGAASVAAGESRLRRIFGQIIVPAHRDGGLALHKRRSGVYSLVPPRLYRAGEGL